MRKTLDMRRVARAFVVLLFGAAAPCCNASTVSSDAPPSHDFFFDRNWNPVQFSTTFLTKLAFTIDEQQSIDLSDPVPAPEPSSEALAGAVLIAMGLVRRRKRVAPAKN